MAVVEGRGFVAPAPIPVALDAEDIGAIRRGRPSAQRYAGATDYWRKGMIADPGLVGATAEWAVKKWIDGKMNAQVCILDWSYKPKGDGGIDARACGLTMQIKGQTAPESKGYDILVEREKGDGRLIPLTAETIVGVCCHDMTRPLLLGWVYSRHVENFAPSPFPGATHKNIEIPRRLLKPMVRLIEKIKAFRRAKACH